MIHACNLFLRNIFLWLAPYPRSSIMGHGPINKSETGGGGGDGDSHGSGSGDLVACACWV